MLAIVAFLVLVGCVVFVACVLFGRLDAIDSTLYHLNWKVRHLLALSEETKEFAAKVEAAVDGAVADIKGLHAKLDEALSTGDVEGARAAIAQASAKLDALAEAVAVPE